MSIEKTIESFILEVQPLGNSRKGIEPDEALISGGIVDSLALLRLVAFIEEQFGVTVEDGELIPDNFETINRIKAYLEMKNVNTSPTTPR